MRISDWSSDVCSSDLAHRIADRDRILGQSLDADIGIPYPVVLEVAEDRPYLFRTIGEVMLPLELHQLNSSIDRRPGLAPRRCRWPPRARDRRARRRS